MFSYEIKDDVLRVESLGHAIPEPLFICKDSLIEEGIADEKGNYKRPLNDISDIFFLGQVSFGKVLTEKNSYIFRSISEIRKGKGFEEFYLLGFTLIRKEKDILRRVFISTVEPLDEKVCILDGDKEVFNFLKASSTQDERLKPFIKIAEPYFNFDVAYCLISEDKTVVSESPIDFSEYKKPYHIFTLLKEQDTVKIKDAKIEQSHFFNKSLDDEGFDAKDFNQDDFLQKKKEEFLRFLSGIEETSKGAKSFFKYT